MCHFAMRSTVALSGILLCTSCARPYAGLALAIGVSKVDPAHYKDPPRLLPGAVPDAEDMVRIAHREKLEHKCLLNHQATRKDFLRELDTARCRLTFGGLFVLSFSGHGSQVPDKNHDEDDGLDETWCLYDGHFLDDELAEQLGKFNPDVRILVFSDSCHSGSILKSIPNAFALSEKEIDAIATNDRRNQQLDKRLFRELPPHTAIRTYQQNKDFYDEIGRRVPREDQVDIQASVIQISACTDKQHALDQGFNGLFTAKLKMVWQSGTFQGSHAQFHEEIRKRVQATLQCQTPVRCQLGKPDPEFLQQRPYTIVPPP